MKYALKFAGSVLAFHIGFCLVYYFACGQAQIPTHVVSNVIYKAGLSNTQYGLMKNANAFGQLIPTYSYISVPLSFLMACTLHVVVLGSFLFVFLAGYGLAYTPLEYLNDFLNRPQIVSL
jgi:hypothetical protein